MTAARITNPAPAPNAASDLNGYQGKFVVVKIGGSDEATSASIFEDIARLGIEGAKVVVVHGGGKALSHWLELAGRETRFVDGLRVTDAETLEVAVMVFAGKVNKEIVSRLVALGLPAVGISGVDAGLVQVEPETNPPGLGLVGRIAAVDTLLLDRLVESRMIPVIAPIAADRNGQMYNVNADTVAAEIAAALGAASLVFVTDVRGVLDASGTPIETVTPRIARQLREEGTISGGMIPKVEAALAPLGSVGETHVVDGSMPHALIDQLRRRNGPGTRFALR